MIGHAMASCTCCCARAMHSKQRFSQEYAVLAQQATFMQSLSQWTVVQPYICLQRSLTVFLTATWPSAKQLQAHK
jgi:hypothetical protein